MTVSACLCLLLRTEKATSWDYENHVDLEDLLLLRQQEYSLKQALSCPQGTICSIPLQDNAPRTRLAFKPAQKTPAYLPERLQLQITREEGGRESSRPRAVLRRQEAAENSQKGIATLPSPVLRRVRPFLRLLHCSSLNDNSNRLLESKCFLSPIQPD